MSQLKHLLSMLVDQPWAMEPATLARLKSIFAARLTSGQLFFGPDLHAAMDAPMPDQASAEQRSQSATELGIAVVEVAGMIGDKTQSLGTSAASLDRMLTRAYASPQVQAVLLNVDSPGGATAGVPELAAKIFAGRSSKPTLALANGLMASAAYHLAAAASEVWSISSGEIGSIGVYSIHEDHSQELQQQGVDVTVISEGKYKTETMPFAPLSEEARAFLQQRVAEAYGQFIRDVARFRGVTPAAVRNGYGQGRVLSAPAARAANLIDRVGTFEEAVQRLAKLAGRTANRGARPSTTAARRRLALAERAAPR